MKKKFIITGVRENKNKNRIEIDFIYNDERYTQSNFPIKELFVKNDWDKDWKREIKRFIKKNCPEILI